jgi:chromosome segregation ATPase
MFYLKMLKWLYLIKKGFVVLDKSDLKAIGDLMNNKIDDFAVSVQREFASLHDEIKDVKTELKQQIQQVKTELKQEMQDIRIEMRSDFSSVRAEIRRLSDSIDEVKERLARLEKRTFEDDDALNKEVVDLRRRLNILEKEFNALKAAQ